MEILLETKLEDFFFKYFDKDLTLFIYGIFSIWRSKKKNFYVKVSSSTQFPEISKITLLIPWGNGVLQKILNELVSSSQLLKRHTQ